MFLLTLLMLMFVGQTIASSPASANLLQQPAVGKVLVAHGEMTDPRFRDSRVLLLQYDQRGTVGLVIDRPTRLSLAAAFASDPVIVLQDGVVSYGGPVEPKSFLALVEAAEDPPQPAKQIFDDIYVTGVAELSAWLAARAGKHRFRIFAGHAGWAVGQLEGEMEQGGWKIVPADKEQLFAGE
jgi:putative transcriptional regulator